MSTRTVQLFLFREGYNYSHACQKGLLTETDLVKQLQFAWKVKKKAFDKRLEDISSFLDSVNFVHEYNPVDQAWAPIGRTWRKQKEGFGCTSKGFLCGTGAKVGNFMVAFSYGKTLNGQYLKWFIEREFVHIIMRLWKKGDQNYLYKTMIPVKTRRKLALFRGDWEQG